MSKVLLSATLLFSAACASSPPPPPPPPVPVAPKVTCDREKDQAAIRAMAGSYSVEFAFEETELLTPGYEKREPSKTGATELVLVIEDVPGRVSLQHLLVMTTSDETKSVIKHWRQDWDFERADYLAFQGNRSWLRTTVPAEAKTCSWTQSVFEVDDSPRYAGFGRFAHEGTSAVWRSNETSRPLPRREYTKRDDYDVLLGVNVHRITPNSWYHDQENEKLVLSPRHSLVRERGTNRYDKIPSTATEPAAVYWLESEAFWKQVREEWARVLAAHPRLFLRTEVDGRRLYEPLFERAKVRDPAADAEAPNFIRDTIASYLADAPEARKPRAPEPERSETPPVTP
jgi:hypothetical protein